MTNRTPYALDDPTVVSMGRFLQRTPLSDGRTTEGLGSPTAELLAQAICNWSIGLVWDGDRWAERSVWETTPDLGDVEIETLADGAVVKMTQRSTGVSALGESHDQAWAELRRKASTNG